MYATVYVVLTGTAVGGTSTASANAQEAEEFDRVIEFILSNVTVIFPPKNTTCVHQPLDHHIIQTFKVNSLDFSPTTRSFKSMSVHSKTSLKPQIGGRLTSASFFKIK